MTVSLELEGIEASYGAARVLRNLTLKAAAGELIALLGPSGCGKTTVLRVAAGLLAPLAGEVRFNGEAVTRVAAERRGAAMVFQKPLLFPHLTVGENVAFGLKMRKTGAAEIKQRVAEGLHMVHLDGFAGRLPKELSGGQEQRVALARALVTGPRLLLLDEPFSALDENLRGDMRALVRRLQRELRITTVFVTHDQEEAAVMADRIALLVDGSIEQTGTPREFYTAPRTLRAARFFGWQALDGPGGRVIAFRPEFARIADIGDSAAADSDYRFEGTVEGVADLGLRVRYTVATASGEFCVVEEAGGVRFDTGRRMAVQVAKGAAKVF